MRVEQLRGDREWREEVDWTRWTAVLYSYKSTSEFLISTSFSINMQDECVNELAVHINHDIIQCNAMQYNAMRCLVTCKLFESLQSLYAWPYRMGQPLEQGPHVTRIHWLLALYQVLYFLWQQFAWDYLKERRWEQYERKSKVILEEGVDNTKQVILQNTRTGLSSAG